MSQRMHKQANTDLGRGTGLVTFVLLFVLQSGCTADNSGGAQTKDSDVSAAGRSGEVGTATISSAGHEGSMGAANIAGNRSGGSGGTSDVATTKVTLGGAPTSSAAPQGGASGAAPALTGASASSTTTAVAPGKASYTPLKAMPARDGASTMKWLSGEVAAIKDSIGGDLVAFFQGSTSLHAATSANNGESWAWVSPAANIALAAAPSTVAQDASGKVHVLYVNVKGVNYARLSLARDAAQHVVGFSAEVKDVVVSNRVNVNMNVRCQLIVGKDQAGIATLLYAFYDDPGTSVRGRILSGRSSAAKGLLPTSSADFVSITGTEDATVVFSGSDNVLQSSHESNVHMAQHPASGDIWYQWGPIDTGDSITSNKNPVMRLRATPSGANTWTLGTASAVEQFKEFAVEVASMNVTPNYVWFMRFSPITGLVIDKADAKGNVTANAIPSPYTVAQSGGYVSLMVDPSTEARALIGGWISYDSQSGGTFLAKYWDGAVWQAFSDTYPPDTWGVGRSDGWSNGLVLVTLDASTMAPSFATIRFQ